MHSSVKDRVNFSDLGNKQLIFECCGAALFFVTNLDNGQLALFIGVATLIITRIFDIVDRRQNAKLARQQSDDAARLLREHTANQVSLIRGDVARNTELTQVSATAAVIAVDKLNTLNGDTNA
jgi:hypothetical protein